MCIVGWIHVSHVMSSTVFQWAQHQLTLKHRSARVAADRQMFRVWSRFVELQPDDTEIARFVTDKINPYTGKAMKLE